jgi:hypothetical protein
VCFYLLRVSTRATLERAWAYLNATALIGISATRTYTKIVVARSVALSAPKHCNKQCNCAIRVSLRSSCKAGNAAAALEACERRLRSHIVRQRIHTKSGRGLFKTWEGSGVIVTSCRRGITAKRYK